MKNRSDIAPYEPLQRIDERETFIPKGVSEEKRK